MYIYIYIHTHTHTLTHTHTHLGGYNVDEKIDSVLKGLGFTQKDFAQSCADFSGGWQMKIALARYIYTDVYVGIYIYMYVFFWRFLGMYIHICM